MDTFLGVVLGLAVLAGVGSISIVLPIWSFVRTQRLRTDLDNAQKRLTAIEGHVMALRTSFRGEEGASASPMQVRAAQPAAQADAGAALAPPLPAGISATAPSWPPESRSPVPERQIPLSGPKVPGPGLDTLETRIGGRWLLYIGMATLVLGMGFFIKYAFENQWINETARVVLGGLIGIAMVAGGLRLARRGYRLYGEIVAGGGFVTMYLSAYAALNFYGLIDRPLAFGLMVVITAASAAVADRQGSLGLAVVALLGGFGTPFLVGGGTDAQAVLLTYDAILVAGTIVLAQRREWPWLNLMSYLLTGFTFLVWAGEYYTPAKYVTTEIFLTLFCGMFLYMLFRTRRMPTGAAGITSRLLLSAPVVYHLASLNNLMPHSLPLLVYLTLATLAGVLVSVRLDRAWLRLVTFALTMPVFLQWLDAHATDEWRAASLVVLVAMYAMPLVAIGERLSRRTDGWPKADLALFHAGGMALFIGLYMIVDATWPQLTPLVALGLALWHFGLAWYSRALSGDAGLNSLAMGFAMVGFAIGLQLDDWWAVVGWAVESGAVVWVGLKSRRYWMRLGGTAMLVVTLARLFALGFFDTPAWFTVVWNPRVGATMVIVAVCYVLAVLHRRLCRAEDRHATREIAAFLVAANVLTILLVTTEISFFWRIRESLDATADLARMASLSIAWGLYGIGLIVAGIMQRYAPIRYLAIALLTLTIGKVFLVDLNELGGIYRIVGFVGLGVFLLLGAWLYQRYRGVILGQD